MVTTERPAAPRLSVGLISALAIAYELLLIRQFSVSQWQQLAVFAISLALLGFGASGSYLALRAAAHRRAPAASMTTHAAGLAASAPLCHWLAQRLSLNADALLWDPWQMVNLAGQYLLLAVPFFFAANCIGLALSCFRTRPGKVYGADLLGAGVGSLGGYLMLQQLPAETALRLLVLLACVPPVLLCRLPGSSRRWIPVVLAGGLLWLFSPAAFWQAVPGEYKGLSQSLRIPDARVVSRYAGADGLVQVVSSPRVPFRLAPGLGLTTAPSLPPQQGVFVDADGPLPLSDFRGPASHARFLGQLSSALPYAIAEPQRVLVASAGSGTPVAQAMAAGAREVFALEGNSAMRAMLVASAALLPRSSPGQQDPVWLAGTPRRLAALGGGFDLIQLDLTAAPGEGAGLHPQFALTVEALTDYLRAVSQQGSVAITWWIRLPPREGVKLVFTAVRALQRLGVDRVGQSMLLLRGWQTATLLLKPSGLTSDQVLAFRHFARELGFDPCHFPGMSAEEANRINILPAAWYYQAVRAALEGRAAAYLRRAKFHLHPATDDNPYFGRFLRWSSLPELWRDRQRGAAALLDGGYLLAAVSLLQALVLSPMLILGPLWWLRRRHAQQRPQPLALLYFGALGLAFMALEIRLLHGLQRHLDGTLASVAGVLAGLLTAAGVGSLLCSAVLRRLAPDRVLLVMAVGLLSVILVTLPLADWLLGLLSAVPLWGRLLAACGLLMPLGVLMGMPFPWGLEVSRRSVPDLIPWAWGINGCLSVVGALLAVLVAAHCGLEFLTRTALCLYGVAMVCGLVLLRPLRVRA